MESLPDTFQPLLWSYDFSKIDPERDKKTIIINVINYGTLAHWRWLFVNYGENTVKRILGEVPITEIRPRVQELAAIIFSVKSFNHAPRGIKR